MWRALVNLAQEFCEGVWVSVWVRNHMAHPMPREFKLKVSEWPEADLAAVADIKMCPKLADGLENFQALSIQILSILGVWSMTLPLASLAVVFTFQERIHTDLEVDDLGPFPEHIKALDHFETMDMSPDEKRVLLGKIRLVLSTLSDLMWDHTPEDCNDLHWTIFQSYQILKSIEFVLKFIVQWECHSDLTNWTDCRYITGCKKEKVARFMYQILFLILWLIYNETWLVLIRNLFFARWLHPVRMAAASMFKTYILILMPIVSRSKSAGGMWWILHPCPQSTANGGCALWCTHLDRRDYLWTNWFWPGCHCGGSWVSMPGRDQKYKSFTVLHSALCCQGVSGAGKQLGLLDGRSSLVKEPFRVFDRLPLASES